jgi:hypothetical protein
MVSGIYFIFQSGKNNFQMCTHKIKIQPNNKANSYKTMLFSRIVMKMCLEMASGGLGGRVVYVASLNTTTVDHQSITSMVIIVQSLLCA